MSSEEESGNEDDLTSIDENPGIFCDWHSVHCVRSGPGYENLELRKCQHPGGTCNKSVHHICAINWGQSKGVPDDIGYTCREHTPAFIEISRQFNPQSETSETGSYHSDDNSNENQNEKTISLEDTDD